MSRWGIVKETQRRKSVEKNSIFSRDNPQLLVTFRRTLFEVMSNLQISILRFWKNGKKLVGLVFPMVCTVFVIACHFKYVAGHGKNRVLSINQVIVGVSQMSNEKANILADQQCTFRGNLKQKPEEEMRPNFHLPHMCQKLKCKNRFSLFLLYLTNWVFEKPLTIKPFDGFLMGTRHSFPQSQVNSYWFSEARWSQLEQISAGQRNALEDGFSMEWKSRAK